MGLIVAPALRGEDVSPPSFAAVYRVAHNICMSLVPLLSISMYPCWSGAFIIATNAV